jgi:hypothetical protein
VGIFHAIEDDEELRGCGDIVEVRILLFGPERDDSLVRFRTREAIESAAVFEAEGRARGAREIDHLLETVTARAAGDEDALQRTFRAQSFDYGMDSNQDGQVSIIPRLFRQA